MELPNNAVAGILTSLCVFLPFSVFCFQAKWDANGRSQTDVHALFRRHARWERHGSQSDEDVRDREHSRSCGRRQQLYSQEIQVWNTLVTLSMPFKDLKKKKEKKICLVQAQQLDICYPPWQVFVLKRLKYSITQHFEYTPRKRPSFYLPCRIIVCIDQNCPPIFLVALQAPLLFLMAFQWRCFWRLLCRNCELMNWYLDKTKWDLSVLNLCLSYDTSTIYYCT